MTISTTTSRISYNGNGVTTIFAVPFRFFANTDLVVQLVTVSTGASSTLTLGTHYTVTGADDDDGGSLTMVTAPAVGQRLVIRRVIPATQEVDYVAGDPFPAETHERALDRLTMLAQQGEEVNARALVFPAGDTASGEIPAVASRANRLLGFNAAGDLVVSAPASGSSAELALSLAGIGGAPLVGYQQAGAGAVPRDLEEKARDSVDVREFGAATTATPAQNAAAINAVIQAHPFREILVQETYTVNSTINLNGFGGVLHFGGGGKLLAGANNLRIFESTTNAFGAKFINPRIDANTRTGVTAFDLQRFQLVGACIENPVIVGCQRGIYLRNLCWGLKITNPYCENVQEPITLVSGCNAVEIEHPCIDFYGAVGIHIQTGGAFPNVGNMILNGFVQNGQEAIVDQGLNTQVIGTYFELNSVADVSLKTDSGNFYGCATNHTASGAVAYRGRNADAAMIVHPFMASGARTTGLFDFDGTNTNCYYDVVFGAGSRNLPIGVVTGIRALSAKPGPIGSVQPDTGAFTTLTSSGKATLNSVTSASGNLSVATATTVTAFTIDAARRGHYEVHALIANSGNVAAFTSKATVLWDGSGGRIVASNGTGLTIALSGSNVTLEQTSGLTQTLYWSALYIPFD